MRIGIDMDDTICRTTEKVNEKLDIYAKNKGIDALSVMNDENLKNDFFKNNLEIIFSEVVLKSNVKNVLRRLRNKGNQLYIITGRGNEYITGFDEAEKVTEKWLMKNGINVDGIVVGAYGENKATLCKNNNIDVMIDDDPFNYKMLTSNGCKCILFDDRNKYMMRKDYATSWIEVENLIEKIRTK